MNGTYLVDPWPVPTGHAWVEIESTTVYEGVTGRFYDRMSYYETVHAVAVVRYTRGEAIRRIRATKHWGPWDDEGA